MSQAIVKRVDKSGSVRVEWIVVGVIGVFLGETIPASAIGLWRLRRMKIGKKVGIDFRRPGCQGVQEGWERGKGGEVPSVSL
jgi:hypothetical protein